MSSQPSGSKQSSKKRASILQGVYEENLRTKQNEPTPRRAKQKEVPAEQWGRAQWGASLFLVVFLLATGAAYVAGAPPFLLQAFPASVLGSSAKATPLADSLQGRAVPFAAGRGVASRMARAVPLDDGDSKTMAGLFGLEVKTVVIDPGHGGKKDGAVGPGGTKEKHVALDIARRLQRRLQQRYGYRVLMTRNRDRHLSLRDRVRFANRNQADLFLSIHINALPDEDVRSVETYYYGQQTTDQERRLAKRENRASGYSVAEFNRLLDQVRQKMRRQESKRLATSIQKSLFRNVKNRHPDVRDWGVRTAPFVVLMGVEAPSILAEVGVISNPAEEQSLRQPAYREQLARFLENGVARYLGAPLSPVASTAVDTPFVARIDTLS